MPYRCSVESGGSAASTILRTVLALAVLIVLAANAAAAEMNRCVFTNPQYQAKGSEVVFEITIDCGSAAANGKPFPIGEQILVGLTVYAGAGGKDRLRNGDDYFSRRLIDAAPEIAAALKDTTQSRSVAVAGGPKWIVLTDAEADSYDLSAKVIRIEKGSKRIGVQFQIDQKAIAGKQYYLFAAWTASERHPCKRDSRYARSGCKRDGYVFGDESGVRPIAAYPGMEINEFKHPNGDEWTAERWIVERFRSN